MTPRNLAVLSAIVAAAGLAAAPAARADTSNCTVIAAVPYTITVAGHYCLASNLVFSGSTAQAIKINQSNVTLDCNEHAIRQDGAAAAAGVFLSGRNDVTVRGCTFAGFQRGIYALGGAPRSQRVRLENNTIVGARLAGIHAELRNGTIAGNRVLDTTGATGMQLVADEDGLLVVEGNTVSGITGTGAVNGIVVGGTGRVLVVGNVLARLGTAATATAAGVRINIAGSVTPSPAVVFNNFLYNPLAQANIPVAKAGPTQLSFCDDVEVADVEEAAWDLSKGCLPD